MAPFPRETEKLELLIITCLPFLVSKNANSIQYVTDNFLEYQGALLAPNMRGYCSSFTMFFLIL